MTGRTHKHATRAARPAVTQQHDVPDAIRSLSSFEGPYYVDLFTATTRGPADKTPEQWVRTAIEGAPPIGRFLAWQIVCGLRLERQPSPDHVGGWKITDRGDNWIRLEASGWFMSAQIVFKVDEGKVSFATFVGYDRPLAAIAWPSIARIHRAVAPDFLRRAVRRIERG
jgi:hypothetical protein